MEAFDRLKLVANADAHAPASSPLRSVLAEVLESLRRGLATRGEDGSDYLHELVDLRPELQQRVARLRAANADVVLRIDGLLWRFAEQAPMSALVPGAIGIVAAVRALELEAGDLLRAAGL